MFKLIFLLGNIVITIIQFLTQIIFNCIVVYLIKKKEKNVKKEQKESAKS